MCQLAETCQIAADRIEWLHNEASLESLPVNPFNCVDPAPPLPLDNSLSYGELKDRLMDEKISLFQRYRAMFTLRNMRSEEGVLALAEG